VIRHIARWSRSSALDPEIFRRSVAVREGGVLASKKILTFGFLRGAPSGATASATLMPRVTFGTAATRFEIVVLVASADIASIRGVSAARQASLAVARGAVGLRLIEKCAEVRASARHQGLGDAG
jgi:hypothetical protein